MVDTVAGWLQNAIDVVLGVVAVPTLLLPRRGFAEACLTNFIVIVLFWALVAILLSGALFEGRFALEHRLLPTVTFGLRTGLTRRVVRSVFWSSRIVGRVGRFFGRIGYSSDPPLARGRYARPRPGRWIAAVLLTVPHTIARVLRGFVGIATSRFVLLCAAASIWAATPQGWQIPAEFVAGAEDAVEWFVSSPASVVAWVAVLAVVIGFASAPARRGRLSWRSSRVQRAHEHLYEVAVRAGAAAHHVEQILEEFPHDVTVAVDQAVDELTNAHCRWDRRSGMVRYAEREYRWRDRTLMRFRDRDLRREREFDDCCRALKRLAKAVRRADDEHVFSELWKLTPAPARSLLHDLRRTPRRTASGAKQPNEPRRFPLHHDLYVIDPALPQRKIESFVRGQAYEFTEETLPGAWEWDQAEKRIDDLTWELHRGYIDALWCLEELNVLIRSVDRHVRPGPAGRVADVIAGK